MTENFSQPVASFSVMILIGHLFTVWLVCTLLDALKNGGEIHTSVWSPYLAEDLAGFIDNIGHEVLVELVPDLVEGHYIRTRWSDSIQAMITNKKLTVYRSPVPKDDRALMTHAKLWLAKSNTGLQLAVGSWNFTNWVAAYLRQIGM
jgi:hypothetical protein